MTKKINDLSWTRLKNGVHFSGASRVAELAEEDAAVSENAASQLNVLKNKLAKEDEYYKISLKNKKTDTIKEQDRLRDNYYISIKEIASAMTRVPDEEMQDAATDVLQSIKDYNISVRDQLIDQTGKTKNIVTDFQTKLATQIEKLGLTSLVEKLKATNDNINTLMKERDVENSVKELGALKAARVETDAAYERLVERVNALNVVDGDHDYTAFIDAVNEEIKKLRQTLVSRKKKTKTDDSASTDSESDTAKE